MGSTFYDRIDVARLFDVPPDRVDDLSVHRCPQGYHEDVLQAFAMRHGLPAPQPVGVVAYRGDLKLELEWADTYATFEEAILAVDGSTRVIAMGRPAVDVSSLERLWAASQTDHPRLRLLGVGQGYPDEWIHRRADSWSQARRYARQWIDRSTSAETTA